ncbi:MAG: hypothetical protein FJ291_20515 [Planctomycetes bacterium]|nr:hypothetical protein [Planctomycetota bacterium]
MARKRLLAPELWVDGKVLRLDDFGKLVFVGMISQSDDEGLVEVDPPALRAALALRATQGRIGRAVEEVLAVGLAVRYDVDGQSFALLPGFFKHQSLDRPTPSKHPRPPDDLLGKHPGYVEGRREAFNRPTCRHRGLFGGAGSAESRRHVGDESATRRPELNGREKKIMRTAEPPDPRIREFREWFASRYAESFGTPYVPAFGADGKALKGVLAALDGASGLVADPVAALHDAAARFLGDTWPRDYGGHTIKNFCGQVNRYLVGARGSVSLLPPEPR